MALAFGGVWGCMEVSQGFRVLYSLQAGLSLESLVGIVGAWPHMSKKEAASTFRLILGTGVTRDTEALAQGWLGV